MEDNKKSILLSKVYKSCVTQKGKKLSEEKFFCWELKPIFLNVFFFNLPDRLLQKGGTAHSLTKKKPKSAKLFESTPT